MRQVVYAETLDIFWKVGILMPGLKMAIKMATNGYIASHYILMF